MSESLDNLIGVAVRATAKRPAFLGWLFAQYQEAENMDDRALAEVLRVSQSTVQSLCLCLRPRAERFVQDIEQISKTFGCNEDALISVVRHVEFLDAARESTAMTNAGRLLAARSRPKSRRRGKGGRKR